MKLAIERNLIYAYMPMDIHNPYKKNFSLPYSENGTVIDGYYWGAEEQMLIDVLGDLIRHVKYKNSKPKKDVVQAWISRFNVSNVNDQFVLNDVNDKFVVKYHFNLDRLKLLYPFLKDYSDRQFNDLLNRTSEICFKMKYRYKILNIEKNHDFDSGKTHVKKNLGKFEFYPDGPQRLFTIEDNKNEDYQINFNTGLGSLFANHMLALEWEWLPFEFYKLSKNTQNLYRKYILVKKKSSEFRVTDIELAKMLKLQTTNRTARKKTIEKLLLELVENGYIEYEIEKGYKDVVFLIRKIVSN